MLQRYTLVTILLHPWKTFLNPYYTMLHPYNTFAASIIKPCYTFCCILIIPCYTLVTLLLHLCKTFATSLFHHLHCGISSVFDIVEFCPVAFCLVAFCPDTFLYACFLNCDSVIFIWTEWNLKHNPIKYGKTVDCAIIIKVCASSWSCHIWLGRTLIPILLI